MYVHRLSLYHLYNHLGIIILVITIDKTFMISLNMNLFIYLSYSSPPPLTITTHTNRLHKGVNSVTDIIKNRISINQLLLKLFLNIFFKLQIVCIFLVCCFAPIYVGRHGTTEDEFCQSPTTIDRLFGATRWCGPYIFSYFEKRYWLYQWLVLWESFMTIHILESRTMLLNYM